MTAGRDLIKDAKRKIITLFGRQLLSIEILASGIPDPAGVCLGPRLGFPCSQCAVSQPGNWECLLVGNWCNGTRWCSAWLLAFAWGAGGCDAERAWMAL